MANLRVVRLSIKSSTTIEILFTANLDTNLGIENVSIVGAAGGISDPTILSASPSEKVLTIMVRPLVPRANYKLTLSSTITKPFKGSKGEKLVEDGSNNVIFFVGQQEDNIVRDNILSDLPDLYTTKAGSLVFDTIDAGATQILDGAHAAGEVRSANYISIEETDVEMTRGSGPYDRFPNEGVYQLLRVGSTTTGVQQQDNISFAEFPADPVSLQQIFVELETVSNSTNSDNSFIGLTIDLSKKHVIKVNSIILVRDSVNYSYDIKQYKYGIKENKHDSDNSYPAVDLNDNQIRLSTAAVGSTFPFPQGSDVFLIQYYYKRDGRDIDSESVEVATAVSVVRANTPAVATSFFLSHAPVITSAGSVATSNGVTWLDPTKNFDPDKKHPAFVTEVPFSNSSLPNKIGEFSVNYANGQVFVFGVNGSGVDGTTSVPPVASYLYKKTYQNNLDYVFFSDLDEIASIPTRDLRGNPATITFNYEDTFARDVDFAFSSHVEVISERVENRLIENIGLYTKYYPVNEVFRIYNETTGELYTPTRIKNNEVYFSATQPPRTVDINREAASFESIIQSQLVITTTTPVGAFEIFTIELVDSDIMSATGGFIGANFNSSLSFSDQSLFARELYFSPDKTLSHNLQRLVTAGDYIVDYESGIVYLTVTPGQSTAIGDATYKRNNIQTVNKHIIRVNNVYRSSSVTLPNTAFFTVGTIEDTTINIPDLENIGETEINGVAITVNSNVIAVSADIYKLRHVFQVTDLQTTSDPIDFSEGAAISNSQKTNINLSITGVLVEDNADGTGIVVQKTGSREYVVADRINSLVTAGLVELVSALSVTLLGGSFNYYAQGNDGYVDAVNNRIVLPSSSNIVGRKVEARYKAKLRDSAAVLVDYITGDVFVDYTYSKDEILVSYEYGDNLLDWSISSTLNEGDTYYATYRYGALRDSLRDNFGVLTSLPELSTIPDDLDRETYRHAVSGSLQTFLKGPTIPSIETLVESFTQIKPNITESVFQEWVLGRDYLHLLPMILSALTQNEIPEYYSGKFGNGLLLNSPGQTAELPATSNMKFNEGTWEAFVISNWKGLENDASITFNLLLDSVTIDPTHIYVGSGATNPTDVPFTLDKTEPSVLGKPFNLHGHGVTGYFIWFDTNENRWRFRTRAPVTENRLFSGVLSTSGEFYDVKVASTADGYSGYDGYEIDEINDRLWSTDESIKFSFIVDSYDMMNMEFDAYDAYDNYGSIAGFDGIDFLSDNIHYFFDTGVSENKCRMSLYKDGSGFLKFRVYDSNQRTKVLSHNIQDWLVGETHHLAVSWKIGTVEQRDELHLFVDGDEVPNMYRFKGYLDVPAGVNKNTYGFLNPLTVPNGSKFLTEAGETLISSVTNPTIGGFDLQTVLGSQQVISQGANFSGEGLAVNSRFEILEDTVDGQSTQTYPYVFVSSVIGQNILELKYGDGSPWIASTTLDNVKYTANPLELRTVSDPEIENVRLFVEDSYGELTALSSPNTLEPDYDFSEDGYMDFVNIYNGVSIGDSVVLKTYGLSLGRCLQYAFIWPDMKTNLLNTIMPAPTAISKINITNMIIRRTIIDPAVFALIATLVGGHLVVVLASSLDFCQPSNMVTGRSLTAIASGDNIDWLGLNQVVFVGTTTDGMNVEVLSFTGPGKKSTTKFFTSLTDVTASFTPTDASLPAGSIEIRETFPLNWPENDGLYAEVHLSVQEQVGSHGTIVVATKKLTDAYARFGAEDIGKTINITSPFTATYSIVDVPLDLSGTAKDSDSVILNKTFSDGYSNVSWKMLNTSYGDSGFANGLLTLETARTGGQPFLLRSCWYEVDFPAYLVIPWNETPVELYTGSDMFGENQADAVIDELRILDEMSIDTRIGEILPSSGRSITTDAQTVRAFETTNQTLALFHFDDSLENSANFITSFSGSYKQSENSVNSSFGQSAVFNMKSALQIDNKSVFKNKAGTIEFWVSPILDTYNDPTLRYYIDLSSEETTIAQVVTSLSIRLPARARSVTSVTILGDPTNYAVGGSLATDGIIFRLGQSLSTEVLEVSVTYVPIATQGDRFSIFKNETGELILSVTASGVDFQISAPIYWKKNTWHRVFAGWDLNNTDNQDRLVFIVDGSEAGIVRYGTGLVYGTGVVYGQKTIWGSADVGTVISRNILDDINLLDTFNTVNIGADFTEQYTALARMDNIRFSTVLRSITYLGATEPNVIVGSGPGRLLGSDLLYTSNSNTALPVISDALTGLLLDFDTPYSEVEYLAQIRDAATGIFDFFVEVIDTFELVDTELAHQLITSLINKIKPSHTRAFVSFIK